MGRDNSPFGPFTRTVESSMSTWTPLGTAIGVRPIRDMIFLLDGSSTVHYQTLHSTSPPTPSRRAWSPVITPRGVARLAAPTPPHPRASPHRQQDTPTP